MQQDLREHQRRAERIEALLQDIASFPDAQARTTAEGLVQALLDMYGAGLARILELTAQSEAQGMALIETFARDDLVGSLLLLHGLHPIPIEARITRALDKLRPDLAARGGKVELLRIENGVACLLLTARGQGCSASISMLRQELEQAIYNAAPDLDGLQIEGAGVPVVFVPPRRRKEDTRAAVEGNVR